MILAIFNCFFVPLQVSFELELFSSSGFIVTNFIIDFLFFVDIVLNFRTEFLDNRGEWC